MVFFFFLKRIYLFVKGLELFDHRYFTSAIVYYRITYKRYVSLEKKKKLYI